MNTVLIVTLYATCTSCTARCNVMHQMEQLQLQSNLLYNQINTAIDESISLLHKSNDTDALEGVEYMQDLKHQLDLFNYTHDKQTTTTEETTTTKETTTDELDGKSGRRKMYKIHKGRPIHPQQLKLAKYTPGPTRPGGAADIVNRTLSPREEAKKKHRLEMEARLQAWIEKKASQRDLINQFRQTSSTSSINIHEECPDDGTKRKNGKLKRYPCCRKCCKFSYMGCL